jgi:hypothetical protein
MSPVGTLFLFSDKRKQIRGLTSMMMDNLQWGDAHVSRAALETPLMQSRTRRSSLRNIMLRIFRLNRFFPFYLIRFNDFSFVFRFCFPNMIEN